tara:strand:- start:609 stop:1142 length:534 start_codon:yes stop_codon:yes gene_type:complete
MPINKLSKILLLFFLIFSLQQCGVLKRNPNTSAENIPTNAMERAKLNVKEGRGISIGSALKRGKSTTYNFNTSNPMWKASLDTLDFLPLSTVDYSGGVVITDWYNNNKNTNESLKITVRFLSNEVRSDSLKITVHQRKCSANLNCTVNVLNSKIKQELKSTIIKKAALIEKNRKKNK